MRARQVNSSRRDPIEALRRGAGSGLAAVLHARYPNLSFEISLGPGERERWPSRAALDAEVRRLKAVGDQPHPLGDGDTTPSNPDHREGAALLH